MSKVFNRDEPLDDPALQVEGSNLEPEEMAALAAVFNHLQGPDAAAPDVINPVRRPDRTLMRRDELGLWARPGADQWRRAAGRR